MGETNCMHVQGAKLNYTDQAHLSQNV